MNNKNDSRADELIKRVDTLKMNRGNFESQWDEVALRVWPERSTFISDKTAGTKRSQELFDSTAQLALTRYAAGIDSLITPRIAQWHTLSLPDPDLNEDHEVREWLESVTHILFANRYSARANFASQVNEVYMQHGAFGTGCLLSREMVDPATRRKYIAYKSIHLAEMFIAENYCGVIDTACRKYKLTARQARQAFGDALPEAILKAAEKSPENEFEFYQCVMPSSDAIYGDMSTAGFAYASYDVSTEGRAIVGEGKYRTMPYSFARCYTSPGEVYGRGPGMMMLADIKMLQEMSKSALRMGQLRAEPPLLLAADSLNAVDLRSNAINMGGLNANGQQMVQPLQVGGDPATMLELTEQRRRSINDAFLVTLFQILVEAPHQQTATEIYARLQEKGQLLGPLSGRIQSELLGPCIEREIDLLNQEGLLPPMPQKLQGMMVYDVKYTSPINRMQRAEEAAAALRTIEALTPISQVDPTVFKAIDTNKMARGLWELNGAPTKWLRSEEEVAASEQADAEQAQLQQLIQAAPLAAGAAKDMAQAQALANQPAPAFARSA